MASPDLLSSALYVRRIALQVQPKRPIANAADALIFLLKGICRCQMAQTGRKKIRKSDIKLAGPVDVSRTFSFTQWPGMVGSHAFALGKHSKITATVTEM